MIQKEYGGFTLTCDICGCSQDFDTFDEAVAYKKNHGWTSSKNICDDWVDRCSHCLIPTAQEDFSWTN